MLFVFLPWMARGRADQTRRIEENCCRCGAPARGAVGITAWAQSSRRGRGALSCRRRCHAAAMKPEIGPELAWQMGRPIRYGGGRWAALRSAPATMVTNARRARGAG